MDRPTPWTPDYRPDPDPIPLPPAHLPAWFVLWVGFFSGGLFSVGLDLVHYWLARAGWLR